MNLDMAVWVHSELTMNSSDMANYN